MIWLTLFSLLLVLVMTYYNWSTNRNSIYLGAFLVFFSLYELTHYFIAFDFQPFYAALFFNHLTPLYLLLGPMLFWYTRGVLKDDFVFKRLDIIHFIPALIQFAAIFEYSFLTPFADKVHLIEYIVEYPHTAKDLMFNSFFPASFNLSIRLLSLIVYGCYSFWLVIRFIGKSTSTFLDQLRQTLVLRWVVYLHLSTALLVGLYWVFLSRFEQDALFVYTSRAVSIQTTIAIITAINNLGLLLFPELLYGIPRRHTMQVDMDKGEDNMSTGFRVNGVVVPFKDKEYFVELAERLEAYMNEDQPYLDIDFDLSTVSSHMKVPQHHISLCLRVHFQENFSTYRNRFRVAYAKELLSQQALENKTLDAIAEESGFKSRTAFYAAFSKIVGATPASFKEN